MVESSYGLGKIEGLEEGIEKGILQTARNMLAAGLPVETVEKCTGLNREEIEQLLAEKKTPFPSPLGLAKNRTLAPNRNSSNPCCRIRCQLITTSFQAKH